MIVEVVHARSPLAIDGGLRSGLPNAIAEPYKTMQYRDMPLVDELCSRTHRPWLANDVALTGSTLHHATRLCR